MPGYKATWIKIIDNFLTKMMQITSLQFKGQKTGCLGSGVEVTDMIGKMLKTAPLGLQEEAGGLSFTMVCFPEGMHGCPRVRDDYMAAVTSPILGVMKMLLHKDALAVVAEFIKAGIGQGHERFG